MTEKANLEDVKKIGIDCGSLYLKVIGLDSRGDIVFSACIPHRGEPVNRLKEIFEKISLQQEVEVNVTGKTSLPVSSYLGIEALDEIGAVIRGVNNYFSDILNIIDIGSGSLSLIRLTKEGEFLNYTTNSLCAAGTGSFLDEQAERLDINYEMLPEMRHIESPPIIATRCAVFAKSDLIHRQQEGYSKDEMWSGLCRGMVDTVKNTLLRGRPIKGKTVVIGGVIRNQEFLRWFKRSIHQELIIPENPHLIKAIGSAVQDGYRCPPDKLVFTKQIKRPDPKEEILRRPALLIEKTSYPLFDVPMEFKDDLGTEVRIHHVLKDTEIPCYLGIDIGSTSTKAVIMNEDDKVVVDLYRKTAGDPVAAVKALCIAMDELEGRFNLRFNFLGAGTTGSGRLLVGSLINADLIKNEITAHVTGAMKVDSSIDTIFEIGGQDSKYIHTKNGYLHNANMNYVCAAGTGSFIEDVARKIGYSIAEIGDSVIGISPPITTDRCTVFMEQDVSSLLQKGISRDEVMAGVLYSIVQNYLAKVVGNRYYSRKKIFFQGATARNKGLVAAFERLLGVEMVVSPYCHVMGAYGIALLTKDEMAKSKDKRTGFCGLRFKDREITLKKSRCELCENSCEITEAMGDDDPAAISWGYMCGRDGAQKRSKTIHEGYKPFRSMKRLLNMEYFRDDSKKLVRKGLKEDKVIIGIPDSLMNKYYLPFYKAFFQSLGMEIKLSRTTDKEMVREGIELSGQDFCLPIKIAHAHALNLLNDPEIDYIFLPYMIAAGHNRQVTRRFFCPYIISHPTVIKGSLESKGINTSRIISPVIDFRWDEKKGRRGLNKRFDKKAFGKADGLWDAFKDGKRAMEDFKKGCTAEGNKILEGIKERNEIGIVILGHPYNIYDPAANLHLIEKLSRLGVTVIPLDFLPLDQVELGEEFKNLFWETGRKIVLGAKFVSQTKNLFALYITNFSCGPDSFVLSYAEEIMQGKPMLMLEIDEHGADAGFMTRLEAFVDVIHSNKSTILKEPFEIKTSSIGKEEIKQRTLLVPSMHPVGTILLSAALRGCGLDARPMDMETRADFELGKRLCRGSECIPTWSTIGRFINEIETRKIERPALFMPTASGPCRFGQYRTLHRIILNRMGKEDVPIFSWCAEDSYAGLGTKERRLLWNAVLISDLLFKLRCRTKPYEKNRGETTGTMSDSIIKIAGGLENGSVPYEEVKRALDMFSKIETRKERRPLVGIVGEIYVRCNPFSNQYLIEVIEEAGGEAWLAPISEWVLYTTFVEKKFYSGRLGIAQYIKNHFMGSDAEFWAGLSNRLLFNRREPSIETTILEGERYFPLEFEGESILTVGRGLEFVKQGADLIINCAPFGCMHGNLTTSVFQKIEAELGVPVINIFYDGEREVNGIIRSIIKNKLKELEVKSPCLLENT